MVIMNPKEPRLPGIDPLSISNKNSEPFATPLRKSVIPKRIGSALIIPPMKGPKNFASVRKVAIVAPPEIKS